jgi:hypothetical protein
MTVGITLLREGPENIVLPIHLYLIPEHLRGEVNNTVIRRVCRSVELERALTGTECIHGTFIILSKL